MLSGWGEMLSKCGIVPGKSTPKSGIREMMGTETDLGEQGLQLRPGQREMGVGHRLGLPRAEETGRLSTQSRSSASVWSYRSCLYASH